MPKYPSDKRHYYDSSDMSDDRRREQRARGRTNRDDRREDRPPHGYQQRSGGGSYSRRPEGSSYPRRPGGDTPYGSGGGRPSTSYGERSRGHDGGRGSGGYDGGRGGGGYDGGRGGGGYDGGRGGGGTVCLPASYSKPTASEIEAAGPSHRPSTSRGEHLRSQEGQPSSAFSEVTSDTASVAGSVASTDARGAFRGKRMLPANLVTRPRHIATKQGFSKDNIMLQANYFKLLNTPEWRLYKYKVDFEPEEDRSVVRKGLLRPHRPTLGAYICDGSHLYTTNVLPEDLELTSVRAFDNTNMLIKLRHVGELNRGDYEYLQFFNIVMRKCLDFLKLKLIGRNYFDPQKRNEIHEYRLDIWPGYITSIRQHEHDILLCAEITHKVMRNDTLLDILGECYRNNPHDYQRAYKNAVIGSVVLTYYNDNTYKIDDVDFSVTPESTFKKKGEEVSYYDYYRNKYNVNISEMRQPLLVSKAKAKDRRAGRPEMVYLVPELCKCTGLTDSMRNDRRLMSALATYTRVSPGDRIRKLLGFNERLQGVAEVQEELRSWSLELDRNLVKIPGRILNKESIYCGDNLPQPIPDNNDWTYLIRNKPMQTSGTLDDWVLLVPNRLRRDAQSFISALIRAAAGMSFSIQHPYVQEMRDDNANTYVETIEDVKRHSNPQLIFCVASNNRLDRYAAIKKKCCVDRPVPTQVVLAKSLSNPKTTMSIATKVAIQLNCKIGGIPWLVSIPLTGCMVVGYDVCHDTNSKSRDFGAMVASIDTKFGRYFSTVSNHTSGEELSHNLSVNICKAIEQFKKINNSIPKRIVVYRDGVGEGQIQFVVKNEVEEVKEKLKAIYDNPDDIKLAYIVVTKKINTRLFYENRNPPPGTVVDDVITDPSKYDFFIVAQQVGQGTVTPTAYNVIEDTSGLDVNKIQRLTYKLCHLYYNWSGTVRVPAPCQYAHKLAFLVSQAIHQEPSNVLETLLYFL